VIELAVRIPNYSDLIFICSVYGRLVRYDFHFATCLSLVERADFVIILHGLFAVSFLAIGGAYVIACESAPGIQFYRLIEGFYSFAVLTLNDEGHTFSHSA